MKKLTILLFILLCTQLYGCSNKTSKTDETVSSAPEASLQEPEVFRIEEDDAKESENSAEEYNADNVGVIPEQKADSVSDRDTENADISVPDMDPQPEETVTTVDEGYYSAATDVPRTEVENYAAQVRQQFLNHDWSAIASEISYPITISDITYNSSADFLDASNGFDGSLEEAFFEALEKEDCVEMFCNFEGIMLGEAGQVWIGEVLDEGLRSQGLKITAINGMVVE